MTGSFSEPALWGWLYDFGTVRFVKTPNSYVIELGGRRVEGRTLDEAIDRAWAIVKAKREGA